MIRSEMQTLQTQLADNLKLQESMQQQASAAPKSEEAKRITLQTEQASQQLKQLAFLK